MLKVQNKPLPWRIQTPLVILFLLLCHFPAAANAANIATTSDITSSSPAAAASDTDTAAEVPAGNSSPAHTETAIKAAVTLKAVEQYDPAIAISNTNILVHNTATDAEVSGTLDTNGQITLSQLPAGTYNIKLMDSYGDYVLAKTSFTITTGDDSTILVQAAISRLTIHYHNLSEKLSTAPSMTIAANTSKVFSLTQLPAGAAVTTPAGFIANGASCGVFAASRSGLPQQECLTVPFKSSEFCIQINDADHYLRIFAAPTI